MNLFQSPHAQSTSVYPETVVDALERWDQGLPLFVVEMGGLGPGYEQCIQCVMFEILRAFPTFEHLVTNETQWSPEVDRVIADLERANDLGLSGAQAEAAKSAAAMYLKQGYRQALEMAPEDRRIQVSRHWPRVV